MSEKYETIVPSEPDAGERLQWVSWLRSAAPYVHLHHGRTFVISFAGEVVADRTLLNHLVMDVSLIASMGMRVVLVHVVDHLLRTLDSRFGITGVWILIVRQVFHPLRVAHLVDVARVHELHGVGHKCSRRDRTAYTERKDTDLHNVVPGRYNRPDSGSYTTVSLLEF